MTSPESEMVAAYKAGQATGGEANPVCPYDGLSTDDRQRVLARMWRRGRQQVVGDLPPAPPQ